MWAREEQIGTERYKTVAQPAQMNHTYVFANCATVWQHSTLFCRKLNMGTINCLACAF